MHIFACLPCYMRHTYVNYNFTHKHKKSIIFFILFKVPYLKRKTLNPYKDHFTINLEIAWMYQSEINIKHSDLRSFAPQKK